MTRVVTLFEVIEQSFVTAVVMLEVELKPEATVLPRTATVQVHGATASGAITVTATPDRFDAGS